MKAVVFHCTGDIRLDTVANPRIEQSTDALVRLTSSAICGTDLHMEPGTIPGHEGVGVVGWKTSSRRPAPRSDAREPGWFKVKQEP